MTLSQTQQNRIHAIKHMTVRIKDLSALLKHALSRGPDFLKIKNSHHFLFHVREQTISNLKKSLYPDYELVARDAADPYRFKIVRVEKKEESPKEEKKGLELEDTSPLFLPNDFAFVVPDQSTLDYINSPIYAEKTRVIEGFSESADRHACQAYEKEYGTDYENDPEYSTDESRQNFWQNAFDEKYESLTEPKVHNLSLVSSN